LKFNTSIFTDAMIQEDVYYIGKGVECPTYWTCQYSREHWIIL